MNEILILSSARKAVLARLSSLGRRFCDDDVNEMVSMTVERFYTRGSYDPSKSSVQTYVGRIASTVVYDFVKAADKDRLRLSSLDTFDDTGSDSGRRLSDDPVRNLWFADSDGADSPMLDRERDGLLAETRSRLSPRFRELFDLLAEGRSHEEIALLTGTTPGNVAVVAYRMRKQFRTFFEEVA